MPNDAEIAFRSLEHPPEGTANVSLPILFTSVKEQKSRPTDLHVRKSPRLLIDSRLKA